MQPPVLKKATFPALRVMGPECTELYDHAYMRPKEDELLVEVFACGICGSDLRLYKNGITDFPYFGHEFSGVVVESGTEVKDFRPGDRIVSGLLESCGECAPCRSGFGNFCEKMKKPYTPGGFAEFCLIDCSGKFRCITKIPEDLDTARATLYEPLNCAIRIVERANASGASRILILGLGTIGVISGLLFKKTNTKAEILGIDTNRKRMEFARKIGVDKCFLLDPRNHDSVSLLENTCDVVVDATGVSSAFPTALRMAGLGGTVILGGVPESSVPFVPLPIFRKELTVVGAKGPYPFRNTDGSSPLMELLRTDDIPWDRMTKLFPFGNAAEAFRGGIAGDALKNVLVLK